MTNETIIVTDINHQTHRLCWSAIIGGAFVGLGLAFLLHLYGVAISLSAISSSDHAASVIAVGGFLGMLLGVIAATATSGFVAGYLGRFHYHSLHGGVIYGFITWSLVLFLSAVMIGPMQQYITAYKSSIYPSTVIHSHGVVPNDNHTTPLKNNKGIVDQPVAQISSNQLAYAGWLIFVLFFVGAISSCIGASYGIRCNRECRLNQTDPL
jgi:hypothetical protein